MQINIHDYRSILCLNGELPEKDFFSVDLPIIAADGAANQLADMKIKPSVIIGDLDSAHPSLLATHETIHLPNQDTCDYEKCLDYMNENHLLPAIIVGTSGGTLDHILNNTNIFMQSNNLLYAPPLIGFTLCTGDQKKLSLAIGTKISLIGLPHAIVNSSGLKWELTRQKLQFPGYQSCFNRVAQPDIHLTVAEGVLLVLIYTTIIQDAGMG